MVDLILISAFFNFVVCSFLTVFLIFKNKRYRYFTLFNSNLVVWSLFYVLSISATDYDLALFYNRICSSCVVIIAYLSLLVCADLAHKKINRYIFILSSLMALVLIGLMNTGLMIGRVRPFLGINFVPDVNFAYYLLILYYVVNAFYGHTILYKASKNNIRNRFIFFAFVLGFLGGTTNFFPYIGIPIYPFGNFLVGFYAILIAYVVLRHRLFDAKMALSLGLAKILAVASLIIAYFYFYNLYLFIIPRNSLAQGLFHIIYFIISCEAYQFLVERFYDAQHRFIKKSNNHEELLKKLNKELSNSIILDDLIKALNLIFNDIKEFKIKAICIKENWFFEKVLNHEKPIFFNVFRKKIDDEILKKLEKIIFEIDFAVSYKESKSTLREIFNETHGSCLIPFISGDKVVGFMMIKAKKSYNFCYEDFKLFDRISIQAGSVLERAKIYNKYLRATQDKVVVEERSKILKSLAGSIAHEMQNPLDSVSMAISSNKSFFDHMAVNYDIKDKKVMIEKSDLDLIIENYEISLNAIKNANKIIDIKLNELSGDKIKLSKVRF